MLAVRLRNLRFRTPGTGYARGRAQPAFLIALSWSRRAAGRGNRQCDKPDERSLLTQVRAQNSSPSSPFVALDRFAWSKLTAKQQKLVLHGTGSKERVLVKYRNRSAPTRPARYANGAHFTSRHDAPADRVIGGSWALVEMTRAPQSPGPSSPACTR